MATNPPSDTIHPSNTLAEQLTRNAVADMWRQLQDAAEAGDNEAKLFLRMFEPFAQEQLGTRS